MILKDPLNEDAVASLRRFAERKMRAEYSEISDESSADSEFEEKVEFITSFGGDEEEPKKSKNIISSVTEKQTMEDINDQKKLA